MMYPGVYRAKVVSTDDPEDSNRVKVQVPQLFGQEVLSWANPVGVLPVPEVGSGVWIMFEGGDSRHPVWLGQFYFKEDLVGSIVPAAIRAADSPSIDAFDRLRVSNPETLFDSKLLWDDAENIYWSEYATGSGTGSAYSQPRASVTLSVSGTTVGAIRRQTKQRFNYQPGKSQLIFQTFVMGEAAAGITRQVGLFTEDNGIFLRQTGDGLSIVRRSSVTGSAVDEVIDQADWNLDPMDGTGESRVKAPTGVDMTKSQILIIDFEWLGVGRVRCGFVIDGIIYYFHQFVHANNLGVVYMSTPNLPVRYTIANDGTGPAADLECICSSVISEGGQQESGAVFSVNHGTSTVGLTNSNNEYAMLALRMKSLTGDSWSNPASLAVTTQVLRASVMATTANDQFLWRLRFVAAGTASDGLSSGSYTWANTNSRSALEVAVGTSAQIQDQNVGLVLNSGYGVSAVPQTADLVNSIPLGSSADETGRDIMVLTVQPLSNLTAVAAITWRELL